MVKSYEMLADILEETGTEYVFGIPGGGTGAIYNSLYSKSPKVKPFLLDMNKQLQLWQTFMVELQADLGY